MIVHRLTDSHTGLILLNLASLGALNICSDRGIEIPTTVKELDERLIKLPQDENDPVPFYLQDPEIRELFFRAINITAHAYTSEQLTTYTLEQLTALAIRTQNNKLLKQCELIFELGNPNPDVLGKRNSFLQKYVGADFALLAETIRDNGQEKPLLLETIQRMIRHAEFRASLKPGQLAPDMTETEGGRRFVKIMAKGTLAFCRKNDITVPETPEKFERVLVAKSREKQENRRKGPEGGIALIDPEAFGDLIEWLNIEHDGSINIRDLANFGSDLFDKTDKLRAAGNIEAARKIDAIKLLGTNKEILSMQEKAHWLREWIGPQAESLAEAFSHGDCQRRLVFEEMRRIIQSSS